MEHRSVTNVDLVSIINFQQIGGFQVCMNYFIEVGEILTCVGAG